MSGETGLITVQAFREEYPALSEEGAAEMAEAIKDNFGDEGMTLSALPSIQVGGQGKQFWVIKEGAEERTAKSVEGIMLAFKARRILYLQKGTTGGPPDCYSEDLVVPVSKEACKAWNTAGVCVDSAGKAVCPYAEFGSAVLDNGQKGGGCRCSEKITVILLMPGAPFPYRLQLPPTSLKKFRQYRAGLSAQALSFWKGVTTFTISPRTLPGSGFTISEANFSFPVDDKTKRYVPIPAEVRTALKLREMVEYWGNVLKGLPAEHETPPVDATTVDAAASVGRPVGTGGSPDVAPGLTPSEDLEVVGGDGAAGD